MLFTCDFLESTFTHFSSLNERHTTFLFILCNVITLIIFFFYVLLTVHLSIFILLINQLDAQNLFYNKFISCLYMFRAPCAHRQEVKTVLYSLWYHHTETTCFSVMIPEAV